MKTLDLPLGRDGSGRFLPWLIALMAYLAALALAGALAAADALERWEAGLEGSLTVEVPAAKTAATDELAAALSVLQAAPGVRSARALSAEEIAALLKPWLGSDLPQDLPLPRLIDVRVDAGTNRAALRARLASAAPEATLDDGRQWLAPAQALVTWGEAVAVGIVFLVAGAAVLSVVFATRTGLAVHHDAVELLHLMGARDDAIVAAFARRALRLGLLGGALGLGLAYATLLPLSAAAAWLGLVLAAWHVAALALLPFAAALLAAATARRTVGRALLSMP